MACFFWNQVTLFIRAQSPSQAREQSLTNSQHSPSDWGYIWPCSSVVERRNNHAEERVQFRSRPVCTRTFCVFIFLLAPRKDGERSKGHGADCGKTLYRRLTVPNYAPEKGKGHPVCSTGSVGGCNDPQQAGNRLYMPPCSCMRRRRHHPVQVRASFSIAPGGSSPASWGLSL